VRAILPAVGTCVVTLLFAGRAFAAQPLCDRADASFDDEDAPQCDAILLDLALSLDCTEEANPALAAAVGTCDESGSVQGELVPPVPARAPETCEGATCQPVPPPVTLDPHLSMAGQPLAVLAMPLVLHSESSRLYLTEAGQPRPGHVLRVDRPPRRPPRLA
jgi:hypothetical protein